MAEQDDRLDAGQDQSERRPPSPGADDGDPGGLVMGGWVRGHPRRGLRLVRAPAGPLCPDPDPFRLGLPGPRTAVFAAFLRGARTLARSRKTSWIGVPRKPNASRSLFSR